MYVCGGLPSVCRELAVCVGGRESFVWSIFLVRCVTRREVQSVDRASVMVLSWKR